MFTLAIMYIFIYFQILCLFSAYLNNFCNLKNIQHYSLNTLVSYLKTYSNDSNKFILLVLLLSGLPPVFIFFLKLIFFLKVFSKINFFFQIILFINFFLGMLFYLQIFNSTTNVFFSKTFLKSQTTDNSILSNSNNINSLVYYKY